MRPRKSAEARHLHLQPRSIFLWPCCWKLQLLAAAQAHLDGSEEEPPSLWENTLSSESSLYVPLVSARLVYTWKANFQN